MSVLNQPAQRARAASPVPPSRRNSETVADTAEAGPTCTEVVASGGAGTLEPFREAAEAGATVLLAASVFHFGVIAIPDPEACLRRCGLNVRTANQS